MAEVNPLWDEFILWKRTPEGDRGEVTTQEQWAKAHGISDRTLRKWKSHEGFVAREREITARFGGTVEDYQSAIEGGTDEADYQLVKSRLVAGAKQGNPKYIEMYFRTYGKPFVDEEVSARSSNLGGLDLDELVSRAVTAVGADLVAAALREQGWTVLGPVVDEDGAGG